jgi:hypothetical protein
MDEKRSQQIKEYILNGEWIRHTEENCAGNKTWSLIDLPLTDLKLVDSEQRNASRIVKELFQVVPDFEHSYSLGGLDVLRIRGDDKVARVQRLQPDLHIIDFRDWLTKKQKVAQVYHLDR